MLSCAFVFDLDARSLLDRQIRRTDRVHSIMTAASGRAPQLFCVLRRKEVNGTSAASDHLTEIIS